MSLFEVLYDGKWHGFNLLPHRVVGDMPIFQAAVQEAIEARGWWWRIESPLIGVKKPQQYFAEVSRHADLLGFGVGKSAAEAMLLAHLDAIEEWEARKALAGKGEGEG